MDAAVATAVPSVRGAAARAVIENARRYGCARAFKSMIRKSGYRFSEKIMLKQKDWIMNRSNRIMI
jgi:hypothetical protein